MKKVFLLAVALLAFCAAKAQPAVGDFTWGAKVGFNATGVPKSASMPPTFPILMQRIR